MLEAQHHLDSDLIMALLRLSRPRIQAMMMIPLFDISYYDVLYLCS